MFCMYLLVFYICVKFHENTLNGFQLTEGTQVHGKNGYGMFNDQKGNNPKVGKPELIFMSSACRLIVLYICVKFGENILDGIRVMEWTRMMEEPDGRTDGHSKFQTL